MTNKVQFITVSDYLFDAKELLPKPISEYVPEWYANIPIVDINTNFHYINKKRTAKTCPSFIDIYREGYVIFSPTDVLLKVNEDGSWEWRTPMNFEIESKMELVSVHEDEQLIDYLENTDIKKVFKINLPIKIITPKGYNSRQIHFPYSNTSEWETAYGVMSTDKVHDLNIQILIKNYGETLIKQGTPIAVYIPFKREKYKHEIHREADRPDLRKKINKKYLLFNGTFKNTYLKEHKK